MIYLLYFDRLTSDQKRAALFTTALVAVAEASLLLLSHFMLSAVVLAAMGLLVLCLFFRKDSLRLILALSWVDLLIYAVVLALTARPLLVTWPSTIPHGYVFSRLDLELLSVVTLTLLVAIAFPSVNDLFHIGEIRPVQYLSFVPFGPRRGITAGIALIALSGIAGLFLLQSEGLAASVIILALCGACIPWLFQYAYGYRSYIMVIFGLSLAGVAVLALLIRLPFIDAIPQQTLRILLLGCAGGWVLGWGGAAQQIWRNTNPQFLVQKQNIAHTFYIVVLGLGHLLIYALWISPVVPTL